MQNKLILVIGSKPGSKLPLSRFTKIYTANGASEKSIIYKKKNRKIELICLSSKSNFEKNQDVRKRIIKSQPNRLIIRFGSVKIPKSLNKNCKKQFISNTAQWNFQKKFFRFKTLSMLIAEMFYKENLFKKVKRIISSINERKFQGISTGFYAILLALVENPESKIIVSGIGFSGGSHFYNSTRSPKFNYDARSSVDRFLVKFLLKKYKKKLFSVDNDFVKFSQAKKWKGSLI